MKESLNCRSKPRRQPLDGSGSTCARLISRRTFVRRWLALPAASAMVSPLASLAAADMRPVLSCTPTTDLTLRQTAGPFYTDGTPKKLDFRRDDPGGDGFTLAARVVDQQCNPRSGVMLDLWHADSQGRYDNQGYRLRGHVFSDDEGRCVVHTITPGLYPGRTRHFHISLSQNGSHILTTQLYFPAEAQNLRDNIFHPSLVMQLYNASDGRVGRFLFVIQA